MPKVVSNLRVLLQLKNKPYRSEDINNILAEYPQNEMHKFLKSGKFAIDVLENWWVISII